MIQCVGSRNDEHPYCSRICCSMAVKNALAHQGKSPETNVYVLYRDVRTYGFREMYYKQAREAGVVFIRYAPEAHAAGDPTSGTGFGGHAQSPTSRSRSRSRRTMSC